MDHLLDVAVEEEELEPCPICDRDDEEGCTCAICPVCFESGDPECIEKHGHIPDPVTISEAAKRRGKSRDVVYRWVRNGWVNAYKVADVRTAPLMVSEYQIMHFRPPKGGWPKGRQRCQVCGKALVEGHECQPVVMDARGVA